MNYIVMDLEWNQSAIKRYENSKIPFEVIEIGAVKLNEDMQIVDHFQSLVKPVVYHKMHNITAELLKITMEQLEQEREFVEVANEFLNWCGNNYIFCIWGNQDLTEFQRNLEYFGMSDMADGPIMYYDVQKLYAIAKKEGKDKRSLSHAVEEFHLKEERMGFHRAYGDAYYTAKVMECIQTEDLLKRVSFDNFHPPKDSKNEVLWHFGEYSKYISKVYTDKIELMHEKKVSSIPCITCGKALRKKIRWFSSNGKNYYAAAHCVEHGYMRGKIRVKKYGEDLFAVKTVRAMDSIELEELKVKKQKTAELKKLKRKRGKES